MRAPIQLGTRADGLPRRALIARLRPAAAFLAEQSDGDEAVRREVESLLAAHDAADGFLDEPVPGPTNDHDALASAPRLAMGSRLGAFEILDLLGAGGMGEVYRARDTRLDRFVAVKVISSALAIDSAAGTGSNARRAPSRS